MSSDKSLGQRPEWIKAKACDSSQFEHTHNVIKSNGLRTVCEEALCPNICKCWTNKSATFLIMGDVCTRTCGFCNIKSGCPSEPDLSESDRIVKAVSDLELKYVVVTSVTRDDLPDGGASRFASVISSIKKSLPDTKVEVLVPDFKEDGDAVRSVISAGPDVFAHNIEVVKKLHSKVKGFPSDYDMSLRVLKMAKEMLEGIITKTGLIVGVGETDSDVLNAIEDVAANNVNILTIGQYLTPTTYHYPIARYVTVEEFSAYARYGEKLGINVIAGPLVRSSYNAVEAYEQACHWK
jgi:lipoic acid synthetase